MNLKQGFLTGVAAGLSLALFTQQGAAQSATIKTREQASILLANGSAPERSTLRFASKITISGTVRGVPKDSIVKVLYVNNIVEGLDSETCYTKADGSFTVQCARGKKISVYVLKPYIKLYEGTSDRDIIIRGR